MAVKVVANPEPLVLIETESCWEGRSERGRNGRASYWNSCRSSSGAYHGAIVIFVSYDVFHIPKVPDVYDLFQIFLHETCSHEIDILVCELVFSSETELPCYAATYLIQATIDCSRFVTKASSTSTTLIQQWHISADFSTTTLIWLRICDVVQPNYICLATYH